MVRAAALVLALTVATGAAAQTTHCEQSVPGMPSAGVDCRTNGAGTAAVYTWQNVPARPCSAVDRMAYSGEPSYCAAREIAAQRKAIGQQIAEGKCDDAIKAALGTGDLQFASEVRAYCAAPK